MISAGAAMLGSAAIGAAGSLFSSSQSARASEQNYKHRYQWQVADLKKAGLNPMLAVSQGAPNVPQPQFENVGEGALKGVSTAVQARLLSEQLETQKAVTGKTIVEGKRAEMENTVFEASPLYQEAIKAIDPTTGAPGASAKATERFDAELTILKEQGANLVAERSLKELQAELARRDVNLKDVQVKYADELAQIEVRYRKAMADAAEAGVPAAQAEAAFWASAGPLGKLAVFLKGLLK